MVVGVMTEGDSGRYDTLQTCKLCTNRFRMLYGKALLDKWPVGCLSCVSGLDIEQPKGILWIM